MSFRSIAFSLLAAVVSTFAAPIELTLGKSASPLRADGAISKEEYAAGAEFYAMESETTGELSERKSALFLARTQEALFLAIRSEKHGNIALTDKDKCEFAISMPATAPLTITVDSLGKGDIPDGVASAVSAKDEFTAEVAIPWSVLKTTPGQGGVVDIRATRVWPFPDERSTLRLNIVLDDTAPGIASRKGNGPPIDGYPPRLEWHLTNQTDAPCQLRCQAEVQWIGNPELLHAQKELPAQGKHTFLLPLTAGSSERRQLASALQYGEKNLLKWNYAWSGNGLRWDDPNPHVGLSRSFYPTLKRAKARVYCSKAFKLDAYKSVHFKITSLDKKEVFYDIEAKRSGLEFRADWDISRLERGHDYLFIFERFLKDGKTDHLEQKMSYQSFDWENNQIGLERVVIPPFSPLRMDQKSGILNATLTEYGLGGENLLDGVTSKGAPILSGPVKIFLNGTPLRAGTTTYTETSDDRVQASKTFTSPELDIQVKYDADFDGFILATLLFHPKGKANIRSLDLEIPYCAEVSKLMHTVACQLRRNPAIELPQGNGLVWDSIRNCQGNFRPYVWIGELAKGFSWLCESRKHWGYAKDKPVHEVFRDADGSATLKIHMFNAPCVRTRPFEIEMGFQASPVKPMMPNYRRYSSVAVNGYTDAQSVVTSMNLSGYGEDHVDSWACGWEPVNGDYSFVEYQTTSAGQTDQQIQEKLKEFLERNNVPEAHRKKLTTYMSHYTRNIARPSRYWIPYTNPRGISKLWPEYATFACEWWNSAWADGKDGAYFANPVKSYRDYILPKLQKFVRHGFSGIYFDNTYDSMNEDDVMGPAMGFVKDGTFIGHHTMLEMRRLIRRTAIMLYLENKLIEDRPYILMHTTNCNALPVLSFASHQVDWEAYYGKSDYIGRFSNGYILSETTGLQTGCVPLVIVDAVQDSERLQENAMALLLPYGLLNYWQAHTGVAPAMKKAINAIRRFGYADSNMEVYECFHPRNPLKITGSVRAMLLHRGQEALVAAGEYGDTSSFRLDVTALGWAKPMCYDAITGERLGEGNVLEIAITPHRSRTLVLGNGERPAVTALLRATPSLAERFKEMLPLTTQPEPIRAYTPFDMEQ